MNTLTLTDSELATVKAALSTASDYWEGIINSTNSDGIRDMAFQQQSQHNKLAARIEQEAW